MDKQENFELNTSYVQVVDRYREAISDLKAIVQRLKAENVELKKQINDAEKYIDELQDALRDMELEKENNKDQYRKALEEVREIANNFFEECGISDDYFKRNNYSWKQHQLKALTCKLQQIQEKINEVLKDEY